MFLFFFFICSDLLAFCLDDDLLILAQFTEYGIKSLVQDRSIMSPSPRD